MINSSLIVAENATDIIPVQGLWGCTREINKFKVSNVNERYTSDLDNESVNGAGQMDINKQILQKLKQLNGRIDKVEEKVEN